MIKEKTVFQELLMQLKLQLGDDKVSQMFDEVYWSAKEQDQIERAFDRGYFNGVACTGRNGSNDYQSKYGGEDVDR